MTTTTTGFGELLLLFCKSKQITTYKQLEAKLALKNFDIDRSSISRYANGSRKVPADFIYALAITLDLDKGEISALVNALMADLSLEYFNKLTQLFNEEHTFTPDN